ncbi:hypothetical protein LARV_00506 [Longilinea arvoryzae]|uniref:Uncharacterized protein n=1 Tax=Longilinea arvoryzae TaxID=360412 RepID=A0A0S7BFH3_9CHLR|nr:hypothetical protein [Longilinea arvoryzae]GAP12770.1 hypothetical protein LARV_00506 [Longilinea arvoryzae]
MKKILFLLPFLLVLAACAAQFQPTPDLTERVNATLTAMAPTPAPTETPLTAAPTATPADTATAAPPQTPAALSVESLRNGVYTSPDWDEFQLTEGIYYRTPPTSQESPEAYTTRMLDTVLYGDLNSDGAGDALVFLATQNGGTGHFIEMAAVLNLNGQPSNVSTVALGDRVVVESGTIQDGLITLNMRVQGPNDGMCCPSQSATWTFRLENGQLVKIS